MKKLKIFFVISMILNFALKSQSAFRQSFNCFRDTISVTFKIEDSLLSMQYELNSKMHQRRYDSVCTYFTNLNTIPNVSKCRKRKNSKRKHFVLDSIKSIPFETRINFLNKQKYSNSSGSCDTLIFNCLVQLYKNKSGLNPTELWGCVESIRQYLKTVIDVERNMKDMGQESMEVETTKSNLLQQFNMKIYNDAKGFNQNQPNGLVQTEVGFSWRCSDWFRPIRLNKKWNLFLVKNIVLPTVNLFQTKSDTLFRYTPVHYEKHGNTIDSLTFRSTLNVHTLNLIKYAHYSVSGKVNIITFQTKNKSFTALLDLYGVFYASGVSYDSTTLKQLNLEQKDSKLQIYSAGGGINFKVKFSPPQSCLSMEASVTNFGLSLLDNDIKQSYGSLYFPDYNSKNYTQPLTAYKSVKGLNNINIYNIQVRYSKTKNKDNLGGTGFFLRLNFYANPFIFTKESKVNYGNNYMQIQIGISKSLDEFLDFVGITNTK